VEVFTGGGPLGLEKVGSGWPFQAAGDCIRIDSGGPSCGFLMDWMGLVCYISA